MQDDTSTIISIIIFCTQIHVNTYTDCMQMN